MPKLFVFLLLEPSEDLTDLPELLSLPACPKRVGDFGYSTDFLMRGRYEVI